jgi:tyrosyl-tRNA synthetase
MHFRIDTEVLHRFPHTVVGVVVVWGANNTGEQTELAQLLHQRAAELRRSIELSDLEAHPSIQVWRRVFSSMGASRYHSSVEALVRRVLRGEDVPHRNPAVDLGNLISLKYLVPVGCHDLDRLKGDLAVRISRQGDTFTPINTTRTEQVPPGEVVYADDAEVRTRRWVWRQGEGAKVTTSSQNIFFPIDGFRGINEETVRQAVSDLASLAARYLGGTVQTFFLSADNPQVELRPPAGQQIDLHRLLERGVSEIIPRDELERRLLAGEKLRIYYGVDPTSPQIHLGHAVCLRKLRQFQDLGHKVILLIGDFTGRIGDPTDRSATRVQLTHDQVLENARTYRDQAAKILDFESKTNPVEVRYNGEWWDNMTARHMIELAAIFTVQQMLERDMFQRRLAENRPIGLHEFLYPLLQGYDSVAMDVDAELGGTDQTFNMLAGRTLMRVLRGKEKIVIACPLLEGTDGRKMSKTFDNIIAVTDPPEEMYGRVMSLRDDLIIRYFELCTDVPDDELKQIEEALFSSRINPMEVKKRLAREIVTLYHGAEAAKKAEAHFERVFQRRQLPEEMPVVEVQPAESRGLVELLVETGLASSKSEARRLIQQGGISVDGQKITDIYAEIPLKDGIVLRAGRRRFVKIALPPG